MLFPSAKPTTEYGCISPRPELSLAVTRVTSVPGPPGPRTELGWWQSFPVRPGSGQVLWAPSGPHREPAGQAQPGTDTQAAPPALSACWGPATRSTCRLYPGLCARICWTLLRMKSSEQSLTAWSQGPAALGLRVALAALSPGSPHPSPSSPSDVLPGDIPSPLSKSTLSSVTLDSLPLVYFCESWLKHAGR